MDAGDLMPMQSAVTTLVAVVTAASSVALTYLTWVLARESKRLSDATGAPQVVATLEPTPVSVIHTQLVIHNAGNGTAFDIRCSFDPPLVIERSGKEVSAPSQLSLLRPGQTFVSYLSGFERLDEKVFDVEVTWARAPNSSDREQLSYRLDLKRDYQGWGQLGGPPPAYQTASELKKFREDFGRLASGFRRLGVDVHDARDRLRERRAMERAWRAQKRRESDGEQ